MINAELIKKYIEDNFKYLGINKKQEIARLVFEIINMGKESYEEIIKEIGDKKKFSEIKKILLQRRFPNTFMSDKKLTPYLPKLMIEKNNKVDITAKIPLPEFIYYDRSSENSAMLKNFKSHYRDLKYVEIPSMKEYLKEKEFSIRTYNKRHKSIFIIKQEYDLFKPCPCTKSCVCCNYHIFNMGFGCPYECTYCYLQEYTNSPGIIIPSNIGLYLGRFNDYKKKFVRIGSGEFSDSLAYDDITGFSEQIIDYFRKRDGSIIFEFKTKSAKVDNIVKSESSDNIVVSWSLNPQKIIDKNEYYTQSLQSRINAAKKCVAAGYKVGFHFDPVIFYEGWNSDYKDVVDYLFDNIKGSSILWISLGTFRFKRQLKGIIENRFPGNNITTGELLIGFDGKLRYSEYIRSNMYKSMIKWIRKRSNKPFIYLCMENAGMWKECGLKPLWKWK
ncbi:radical SAM protein [Elusimicrobiota bacterium]